MRWTRIMCALASSGFAVGAIRGRATKLPKCQWTERLRVAYPALALARPARRNSVEHALYAYVFVNFRPAYSSPAADDLESCTLVGSCLGEPPGPHQRNTNRPRSEEHTSELQSLRHLV